MIIKLKMAKSFSGQLNYILREGSKQLFSNAVRYSPAEINTDMEFLRNFNNHVDKPSMHIIISFDKADDTKLDETTLINIGKSVVTQLGATENHQYVAAQHFDGGSPHLHICLNWVGLDGKALSNAYSHIRLNKIRIGLEKEYPHLKMASEKNLDLTNQHKLKGADKIKYKIYNAIKNEMETCKNITELIERLEKNHHIKSEFKLSKDGIQEIQGIRFNSEAVWLKGSAVDKMCSFINLVKYFDSHALLNQSSVLQETNTGADKEYLKVASKPMSPTSIPLKKFKEINNEEIKYSIKTSAWPKEEIKAAIKLEIENSININDLIERLEKHHGIITELKYKNGSDTEVQGIKFKITDGEFIKGSDVHRDYGFDKLQKHISLLVSQKEIPIEKILHSSPEIIGTTPLLSIKKMEDKDNIEITGSITLKPFLHNTNLDKVDNHKSVIHGAIKIEMINCKSIAQLMERLEAKHSIKTELKYYGESIKNVQGIIFKLQGSWYKGSEINNLFSYGKLVKQILENQKTIESEKVAVLNTSSEKPTIQLFNAKISDDKIIKVDDKKVKSDDTNNIKQEIKDVVLKEFLTCNSVEELMQKLEKVYQIKMEITNGSDNIFDIQEIIFSKDNSSVTINEIAEEFGEQNFSLPKQLSEENDDSEIVDDSIDFETDKNVTFNGISNYSNGSNLMTYFKMMLTSNGSPKVATMRNNGEDTSPLKKKKKRLHR